MRCFVSANSMSSVHQLQLYRRRGPLVLLGSPGPRGGGARRLPCRAASHPASTARLCRHGPGSASSSRAKFYTHSASGNGASRLGFHARALLCAKQQRSCSLLPVHRVTFIPGPARRGEMRSSVSLLLACLGFAFLKPAPSPAAGTSRCQAGLCLH